MATILPSNWREMLERVRSWLEHTAAEADRRQEDFRDRCECAVGLPSMGETTMHGRELLLKMQPLDAAAAEADAAAEACEGGLREMTQRSETLRRRLAERVG